MIAVKEAVYPENRGKGKILQVDFDGNIIRAWKCAKDVVSELKCSSGQLSECLRQKAVHHKGFIWVYEKDKDLIPVLVSKLTHKKIPLDLEGEEWRDVKGYEGKFQVSNLGRIKSLKRWNKSYTQILTPKENSRDNYLRIALFHDAYHYRRYLIHRLVAEAFIPNPNNLPIINHKDENRQNNRVENLEWCDYSYNAKYSVYPGNQPNRVDISLPLLQYTVGGEFVKEYPSIKEAARQMGCSTQSISCACNGKTKTSGGYVWKYAVPTIVGRISDKDMEDVRNLYMAAKRVSLPLANQIKGSVMRNLQKIFGTAMFEEKGGTDND